MTVANSLYEVNTIDLKKLDPVDDALALMYYGWRGMTRDADAYLATLGLSRVHHRMLYAIARAEAPTVTALLAILGVSKQALHRPMRQLLDGGYVETTRDPARHRFKILALTPAGREVEHRASEHERRVMREAFDQVGRVGRDAWAEVMASIARHSSSQ